jgi:hypothetical protein
MLIPTKKTRSYTFEKQVAELVTQLAGIEKLSTFYTVYNERMIVVRCSTVNDCEMARSMISSLKDAELGKVSSPWTKQPQRAINSTIIINERTDDT